MNVATCFVPLGCGRRVRQMVAPPNNKTALPNGTQVSGYLLQTVQSWANAVVTKDGHCQGACRP